MNYKDGHFNCYACGAKQAVKFPIEVKDYTAAMVKFLAAHGECKKQEKTK
jgi:hypothetical protein